MARTSAIGMDVRNLADGGYFGSNSATDSRVFQWSASDIALVGQQSITLTLPDYAATTLLAYHDLGAKGDLISASDANTPEVLNVGADGQLLSADSTADSGLAWKSYVIMQSEAVSADHQLEVNKSYIAEGGTKLALTLPATAAKGSVIRVSAAGTGGFRVAQNAGQTVHIRPLSTTAGATGNFEADQYSIVEMLCIVADTDFIANVESGNVEIDAA